MCEDFRDGGSGFDTWLFGQLKRTIGVDDGGSCRRAGWVAYLSAARGPGIVSVDIRGGRGGRGILGIRVEGAFAELVAFASSLGGSGFVSCFGSDFVSCSGDGGLACWACERSAGPGR